ncbi:MAG: molybdenum cofactor biosynthesis protein MoaE [Bacteroidota bacterium]
MDRKKQKNLFVNGPIQPEVIADSIGKHSHKKEIGAHSIFLGQVRADQIKDQHISSITFSAHVDMANDVYAKIREAAFARFDLICAHVYHSIGSIRTGELCFFVFTSSQRRKMAIEACNFFVEEIKRDVPIFGQEFFESGESKWKVNS